MTYSLKLDIEYFQVEKHKTTSSFGPAHIVLAKEFHTEFEAYMNLRSAYLVESQASSEFVFFSVGCRQMYSSVIAQIFRAALDNNDACPTRIRKAIVLMVSDPLFSTLFNTTSNILITFRVH